MKLKAIVKDINEVPEAFRALYTERNGQWELTEVEGFRTQADVDRLTTSLQKERGDHDKTKLALKAFNGLNPEEVTAQLARIPELEIAAEGKIDDKKIDKLVETRIAVKLAPVQRELEVAKGELVKSNAELDTFRGRERTRTIHDAVRDSAAKSKLLPTAVEDALMVAERVFDIDADGRTVITKEGVGVTPGIAPDVWLSEMQSKRPHWWAPSQGGGASGQNGGGALTNNPFSREHWNMTQQGQLVRTDRAKAEQYAKAAGTTIGGGMPPPKA